MTFTVLENKQIDPEIWDRFVTESNEAGIYHLHQFLSNLIPQWRAVVALDNNEIIAAFPFETKKKFGISYGMQPFFAQYLGMIFRSKNNNVYKELEQRKKLIQGLCSALPEDIKLLNYNFSPGFDYHLPLQWLGWKLKTNYTYWVDIRKGYDSFINESASHVRRELKKSINSGIEIRETNDPKLVIQILLKAKPELKRIIPSHYFDALAKNSNHFYNSRKSLCLIAYSDETPIAGIIYFFHKNRMIYYQGSTLPDFKNSGAMTHIICESVRRFGHKVEYLDFDGSMLEPIERFFRGFSAFPVPYYNYTMSKLKLVPQLVYASYSLFKKKQ